MKGGVGVRFSIFTQCVSHYHVWVRVRRDLYGFFLFNCTWCNRIACCHLCRPRDLPVRFILQHVRCWIFARVFPYIRMCVVSFCYNIELCVRRNSFSHSVRFCEWYMPLHENSARESNVVFQPFLNNLLIHCATIKKVQSPYSIEVPINGSYSIIVRDIHQIRLCCSRKLYENKYYWYH